MSELFFPMFNPLIILLYTDLNSFRKTVRYKDINKHLQCIKKPTIGWWFTLDSCQGLWKNPINMICISKTANHNLKFPNPSTLSITLNRIWAFGLPLMPLIDRKTLWLSAFSGTGAENYVSQSKSWYWVFSFRVFFFFFKFNGIELCIPFSCSNPCVRAYSPFFIPWWDFRLFILIILFK